MSRPASSSARAVPASLLALVLVLGAAPAPPASAAPAELRSAAGSAPAVAAGQVILADGASATRTATVTVAVPAPTGPVSLLRVSNDEGATWVERSYATAFAWSLIDEAAGGVDQDGSKSVTVEAGDGVGPWVALGADTILLDRTGPTVSGIDLGMIVGWRGSIDVGVADAGVGILRTEVSLDGTHWRWLSPSPFTFFGPNYLDYREGTIGGTWEVGPRSVHVRAVDRLGNVGPERVAEGVASDQRFDEELPAVFELPLPAVAGQPFTVRPVFDAGYRMAAGQTCAWTLNAGSQDVRLEGGYDETLVGVTFSVPPRNGVCTPWTFTLPYTPPLEYTVSLAIAGPNRGETAYVSDSLSLSFRASPGSTSRAITTSNLPLYYMLPDRVLVDADGTVTYRIYTAGGAPSRSGLWYCEPAVKPPHVDPWIPQEQRGGSSFRCRVNITGPWVTTWFYEAGGHRWMVVYDPIGDTRRPTVTAPVLRVGAGASPSATYPPVSIVWSGRDIGTGLYKYELQRSINGGSYRAVTLPSARATAVELRLHAGWTYRFRVRARDRAGNWSAWAYGASTRAALHEETSRAFSWSSGWSRVAATGASGGAVRFATAAARTATFRFSGRAVGWFARRGPGQGFAQLRVDGVLVSTISLEAATLQPSRLVWRRTWTSSAGHTIQVRLLGTTGRSYVEVDAFEVVR